MSLKQRLKLSRPDNGGRQDHVGLCNGGGCLRLASPVSRPVASVYWIRVSRCVGSVGNFREGRGVYRDSQFDFSIPFARLSRGSTFFHFSSIDSSVLVFFFGRNFKKRLTFEGFPFGGT